ncbi:MAG TPA: hypothetical protein VE631_04155, partial [Alphaproteobacteria bacterium]|nr:hypothetical protein [Alphaproteobacteria bacterium]
MASQDGDAAWQDPRWALGHYAASIAPGAALRRERTGLLNDTYAVGAGPDFTLQLVEVQFGDDVIERIAAVAPLLAAGGITPPQLVRTDDGALSLPVPDGRRWRLFDWIAGEVHDRPPTPAHARSAGALLARFHDLIRDDASCRAFPDSGFHDTARRMRRLASVIAGSDADAEIRGLADQVLALWADWR